MFLCAFRGAEQVADEVAAEGNPSDPLWLTFCKYDLNDDKKLSLYEIGQMMQVNFIYKTKILQ